jgi:hypothetical protein
MRNVILILALTILGISGCALTIEVNDYGYDDGKIRNYSEGAWNEAGTDISEGTNKVWSFSMPTAGYVNNTFHSVQNVSGFPSANISATYNQYTMDYYSSGTQYYQNTGSDILSIGYTASPNFVWNPAVPMGLPHYLGKTWTGTHSWAYGTYTVSGKVIAEGQVSTPLGSYPALLVRYYYQTNVLSYYYYQWETKEYGIIAYTITVNDGMLYVLNQADPNVANVDCLAETPSLKATISPNPFAGELSLAVESKSNNSVSVSIYDLKGRIVSRSEHPLPAGKELCLDLAGDFACQKPGIYFISIKAGKEKLLRKVTKLP